MLYTRSALKIAITALPCDAKSVAMATHKYIQPSDHKFPGVVELKLMATIIDPKWENINELIETMPNTVQKHPWIMSQLIHNLKAHPPTPKQFKTLLNQLLNHHNKLFREYALVCIGNDEELELPDQYRLRFHCVGIAGTEFKPQLFRQNLHKVWQLAAPTGDHALSITESAHQFAEAAGLTSAPDKWTTQTKRLTPLNWEKRIQALEQDPKSTDAIRKVLYGAIIKGEWVLKCNTISQSQAILLGQDQNQMGILVTSLIKHELPLPQLVWELVFVALNSNPTELDKNKEFKAAIDSLVVAVGAPSLAQK